jgi:hypothetical protein
VKAAARADTGRPQPLAPASPKALARTVGWLYLVIIVGAGLAEGYVRGSLVVPGDAATTASNILESEGLFRFGLVADLVAFLADAAVAVLLYVLLRPVSHTVSLMAAAFRLVAHPAIGGLNLLNHWGALALLQDSASQTEFGPEQLQAMALLSLEAHAEGYLVAGAFFGVHLALLAWLLHRSELFPSALAVLIGAAAVGYLTETLTYFLVPTWASVGAGLVVVTAGVGEVALCLYLIVKGVRGRGTAADPSR